MKIEIYTNNKGSGDWTEIWVDNQLFDEGHSISTRSWFNLLQSIDGYDWVRTSLFECTDQELEDHNEKMAVHNTFPNFLKKLSKRDLEYAEFVTIEEFKEQEETGFYIQGEESGFWACVHEGSRFYGDSVTTEKPNWATHVYWYGK